MKPAAQMSADASLDLLAREIARTVGGPTSAAGESACATIGRTPAVLLRRFGAGRAWRGDASRAEIVAKLESRNPGGSLKDRTALGMVLLARATGQLRPGDALVEPTAGNTGIGLALVGRWLEHDVTIVMPERYSAEKRTLCRALGARVRCVPGASVGMPDCLDVARALAAETGAVMLDQFAHPGNAAIHELTTGPELWAQAGEVDAVVIGAGTGGTVTGVARALRRHLPRVTVHAVESQGSVLGGREPRPTRVEGIGSLFLPTALDRTLVDEVIQVTDEDAFRAACDLAAAEGILAGASSGAIALAALEVARRLGPGRRVATILPDGGDRYWSKGLYASCDAES